jgi:hypothetical protein
MTVDEVYILTHNEVRRNVCIADLPPRERELRLKFLQATHDLIAFHIVNGGDIPLRYFFVPGDKTYELSLTEHICKCDAHK